MPLLYLLLRRDFEIFRICRNNIVKEDELDDSALSLLTVFDAVDERHDDLAGEYLQSLSSSFPADRHLTVHI